MSEQLDKAKGRVKQAAGDLIGDDELRRSGKRDETAGKLKDAASRGKDRVDDTIDRVKDKIDRD